MRRSPQTGGSRQGSRSGRYDGRFALLLIAPAFFFYTIFLILPLFGTVVIGFTDWTGISFATLRFTGLANFEQMAGDEFFWGAFRNSFLFVASCLIIQVGVALLFAFVPFSILAREPRSASQAADRKRNDRDREDRRAKRPVNNVRIIPYPPSQAAPRRNAGKSDR